MRYLAMAAAHSAAQSARPTPTTDLPEHDPLRVPAQGRWRAWAERSSAQAAAVTPVVRVTPAVGLPRTA